MIARKEYYKWLSRVLRNEERISRQFVKTLLPQMTAAVFFLAGRASSQDPKHPSGSPLRYHSPKYNLTFWLPADGEVIQSSGNSGKGAYLSRTIRSGLMSRTVPASGA